MGCGYSGPDSLLGSALDEAKGRLLGRTALQEEVARLEPEPPGAAALRLAVIEPFLELGVAMPGWKHFGQELLRQCGTDHEHLGDVFRRQQAHEGSREGI